MLVENRLEEGRITLKLTLRELVVMGGGCSSQRIVPIAESVISGFEIRNLLPESYQFVTYKHISGRTR
jgi:hypothetical protein